MNYNELCLYLGQPLLLPTLFALTLLLLLALALALFLRTRDSGLGTRDSGLGPNWA